MDGWQDTDVHALAPGELLFINGAAIRVDRHVRVEVLGEASVVPEGWILHADDATLPVRRLYFAVQLTVIGDNVDVELREAVQRTLAATRNVYRDTEMESDLAAVAELLDDARFEQALRVLRELFEVEDRILSWPKVVPLWAAQS